MKFLPENKKRAWGLIALLVILIGGLVFVYFKYIRKGGTLPIPANQVSPAPLNQKGSLLPYGSEIDTKIMEEDSFKTLRGVPPPAITPADLGKARPFDE